MTVFKPVAKLATRTAQTAVTIARGGRPATTTTIDNGGRQIPCVFEEPISVDRANMMETVVAAGFHPADKLQ
jgi:D-xylose transport system substrate-binding protein